MFEQIIDFRNSDSKIRVDVMPSKLDPCHDNPVSLGPIWLLGASYPKTASAEVTWHLIVPVNFANYLCRKEDIIKQRGGTFLVVQGLRIHLLMQRMWVPSLVRELGSHMARSN